MALRSCITFGVSARDSGVSHDDFVLTHHPCDTKPTAKTYHTFPEHRSNFSRTASRTNADRDIPTALACAVKYRIASGVNLKEIIDSLGLTLRLPDTHKTYHTPNPPQPQPPTTTVSGAWWVVFVRLFEGGGFPQLVHSCG